MKKIRVLHFELDGNLGGIEVFLLNLLKQTDRERIQFEFVTAVKAPALEKEFLENGGIIHYVSPHADLRRYCSDIAGILRTGIDVVHIHKNSAANIIPLILSKRAGIRKIFVHSHNTAPSTGRLAGLLHRINRPYLNRVAHRRFACSSAAGKWLFGSHPFEIVTNGILTDNYLFSPGIRDEKRKELGIDPDTLVCGNIGRFSPQKNQKRGVVIFEALKKTHPDSKMLFVGEGELLEQTKSLAVSKNLERDILFLGLRRDIPALLAAMDVFIMPSLYEGLPIAAVEAQAAGLPVMLSDTISPDTQITDAVSWFSLEEDDTLTAQRILQSAVWDNGIRESRGKQVSDKGFDMKTTARLLDGYYAE